jgi:hypothetical protein
LLADLVEVERHIALGKADIADQEAQIAELELDGADRWEALDTLWGQN